MSLDATKDIPYVEENGGCEVLSNVFNEIPTNMNLGDIHENIPCSAMVQPHVGYKNGFPIAKRRGVHCFLNLGGSGLKANQ